MANTTSPNTSTETAGAPCKPVAHADQTLRASADTLKSRVAQPFVQRSWRERLAPHAIPVSNQTAT